jgi:hypothetical protein
MPAWQKELRDLARRSPSGGKEATDFSEAIHDGESDRGCALIAGALAENSLQRMLGLKLIPLGKEKTDDLFGANGPLGTFSSKVKIAFAFGLIDNKLRDDLDRVREIRNAFAHSMVAITFAARAVSKACAGFKNAFPSEKLDSRAAYVRTSITIMHVALLLEQKKITFPASYDLAVSSREKWLQQHLRQIQQNPP